jgi:hypothetical protein
VLCRRPCVIVGGELAPGMLELLYDASSGTYSSPLQMKANGGILIIDDFGRQQMSPRDLLNRWIVPLDRRVDYLALSYGLKFEIPFEVMVVFATNLAPSSLGDEAFLRRIQNKILVEPVNPEMFDEIFRRVAQAKKVALPGEPARVSRTVSGRRTQRAPQLLPDGCLQNPGRHCPLRGAAGRSHGDRSTESGQIVFRVRLEDISSRRHALGLLAMCFFAHFVNAGRIDPAIVEIE